MPISKLIELSRRYGQNPDLVLAGGGNTSVKIDGVLYVKASGTALASACTDSFVRMDIAQLRQIVLKTYPDDDTEREKLALADMLAARMPDDLTKRPSVEALLHALFPQTYVVHLHPALVNGLTCSKAGSSIAQRLFGNTIIWIPPCKPGLVLAKLCAEKLAQYKIQNQQDAAVIFLENHGIFFAANTPEEIQSLLDQVMTKLQSLLTRIPDFSSVPTAVQQIEEICQIIRVAMGNDVQIAFDGNQEILRFAKCPDTMHPLMLPFTPDHIVYCRAYPVYCESIASLEVSLTDYCSRYGEPPRIVIVKNVGVFACERTEKDRDRAMLLLRDAVKIAVYTESFGGVSPMPSTLVDFITHWEVESYRKKQ